MDCPRESAGITEGTAGSGGGGQERSCHPEAKRGPCLPAASLVVHVPVIRAYAAALCMTVSCCRADPY